MAHTEKRASPWREFQLGVVGGAIYGASHTISGHSLDNIKARLQLDPGYRGLSTIGATKKLWAERGLHGFFQGLMPPLIGSSFYRMAMLSAYETSYTYFSSYPKDSFLQMEIAGGYIPRPLVFASALCASMSRSVVESPFEYMKVMKQTDSPIVLRDIYRGVGMQTIRTTSMLLWIFVPYDVVRQKTDWMKTLKGQWATTTTICCTSYAIIWPLETLKNMGQGGIPFANASVAERVKHIGGFKGLYRGAAPGIAAGGIRNGMAMLAMANWQRLATNLGLREE